MASSSVVLLYLACTLAIILQTGADPTGELCPLVENGESCMCNHPDGLIDLTELSNSDGQARFQDIEDSDIFSYDYNPCSTFSKEADCTDIYICQTSEFGDTFPIGDEGTEVIYMDGDDIYLYYSSPADNREAKVHLICDLSFSANETDITTEGDSEITLLYEFNLTSCHACPGGCGGESTRLGAGSITGIVISSLVFLLLVYFIVGAIVMKVGYKKSGLDIIPNRGLWCFVPSMIMPGCFGKKIVYDNI